jgi:hypothetical protein
MSVRIYTGNQDDGVSLGLDATDPISFYNGGTVMQRSNPAQGPSVAGIGGQVVTYQQSLTVASIAANTAAEQAITVGTTAGNGPLTTDFVAAINKPTAQAGMGVHSARISAANTLQLVLSNATATAVTPTANQVYNVALLRGLPVHSQVLTPAAVPASAIAGVGTTSEQIFNLVPVTAAAVAYVNTAGGVSNIHVPTAGSNYTTPPTVLIVDPVGKGASALPIMSAGTVIGVTITNAGSGYNAVVPPIVSFIGGNSISPGMGLMVTKPTTNAGLAIGGCRIVGPNQIAITYVNMTSAAITPTSEAYSIAGLYTMPAGDNVISYGVVGTGLVSVASITSSEQGLTVSGLLVTDIPIGISKPTLSVGLLNGTGRISAANTLQLSFINATQAAVTPSATEIYGVTVLSQSPVVPFMVNSDLLTPVSVAAQTTAEQTFTFVGLPFINSSPSTVFVNKPSFQPGLVIAGCRVTAANTLGITFENVTAAAITPLAEVYTVGVFNAVGAGGGAPGSWVALSARTGQVQLLNLVNELQQALSESGLGAIKGA